MSRSTNGLASVHSASLIVLVGLVATSAGCVAAPAPVARYCGSADYDGPPVVVACESLRRNGTRVLEAHAETSPCDVPAADSPGAMPSSGVDAALACDYAYCDWHVWRYQRAQERQGSLDSLDALADADECDAFAATGRLVGSAMPDPVASCGARLDAEGQSRVGTVRDDERADWLFRCSMHVCRETWRVAAYGVH